MKTRQRVLRGRNGPPETVGSQRMDAITGKSWQALCDDYWQCRAGAILNVCAGRSRLCRAIALLNGPMPRGIPSRVAPRSARAAPTATPSAWPNGFAGFQGHPYEQGFDLRLWPERLAQPLRWKSPRRIFVNSMSDLFHHEIPRAFLDHVFRVMETADWHIYQVLTKRSSLMRDFVNERYHGTSAPAHIWLGVSVEDRTALTRLRHLQQTAAGVRFIFAEPLLGPLEELDLSGIHWIIVGGESGPDFAPWKASGRVRSVISVWRPA